MLHQQRWEIYICFVHKREKKKKKKKNYKYFKKLQNTDEGIGKKKRSNVKLQYCKWLSMCRLIDFGQHAQACR